MDGWMDGWVVVVVEFWQGMVDSQLVASCNNCTLWTR